MTVTERWWQVTVDGYNDWTNEEPMAEQARRNGYVVTGPFVLDVTSEGPATSHSDEDDLRAIGRAFRAYELAPLPGRLQYRTELIATVRAIVNASSAVRDPNAEEAVSEAATGRGETDAAEVKRLRAIIERRGTVEQLSQLDHPRRP